MTDLPDQKIQTIIPAPSMWVREGGEINRVVCFALTVDEYGLQSVIPMAMDSCGDIRPALSSEIIDPETDSQRL